MSALLVRFTRINNVSRTFMFCYFLPVNYPLKEVRNYINKSVYQMSLARPLTLRDAGKKPKVALVAVMHKLITILNVIIKKNEQWQFVNNT